jgi:AAA+ superfamily predicted ATPase
MLIEGASGVPERQRTSLLMAVANCNKCGEQRDLVVAGCVCASCGNALDQQWATSGATDWVLIAAPVESREEYPLSVRGFIGVGKALTELWAKEGGPPEEPKPAVGRRRMFPPLHLLGMVSPDAEVLISGGSFSRFVYGNAAYAEIKTLWAVSNPPDEFDMGPPAAEEMAKIESGLLIPPYIRPATAEEAAHCRAVEKNFKRQYVIERVLERWGFDYHGADLSDVSDAEHRRRAVNAWAELREVFEKLGLLGGSLFDYEENLRAIFPADVGVDASRARVSEDTTALTAVEANRGHGLSQVVGMAALKEQLMHEVIGPFKDPDLYRRYRVTLPNGVLFYGPPGCGKTYIARSLAEELGWHFQYCRPSDVASPYIHDTVSRIRAVFAMAIEKAPSIVFIDEFEAFVPARSELGGHQQYKAEEVNEFLANLEGCAEHNVLVIAATNEPEKIDPAVRRSGRFDKLILIPPPDTEARCAMLGFHLLDRPVGASVDIAGVAAVLEGYSASDIKLLVDEAARIALKQKDPITTDTLLAAMERVAASITAEDVLRYDGFRSRGTV